MWTRIIKINEDYIGETRFHSVLTDMKAIYNSPPDAVKGKKKPWELLFNPEVCNLKNKNKTLGDMRLSESKLHKIAEKISDM